MNRKFPAIVLGFGALLVSGCIQLDSILTLTTEGGAVLEVEYRISEAAVRQLKTAFEFRRRMDSLTSESVSALQEPDEVFLDPSEPVIRLFFKKYEPNGIALDRLNVSAKDGWRQVVFRLSCKNLADAAKTDLFAAYGFDLQPEGQGRLRFYRPAESKAQRQSVFDPEAVKVMTPLCEGFKAAFKLVVPGRVLESNAHQTALRSAVWSFDYNKDQGAIAALQNQEFSVLFETDGARLPSLRRARSQPGR